MRITLDPVRAPCTVHSFVSLADQGFFDETKCHRLVDSGIFLFQCGDPSGTGSGGPGYTFADELDGTESYTKGVVAMANGGANTNGSQFMLVYRDSRRWTTSPATRSSARSTRPASASSSGWPPRVRTAPTRPAADDPTTRPRSSR